jgi:hypothetical protein
MRPENVEELQRALDAEGFDPNQYTLWASDRNDNLCLERAGHTWTVYYSERGSRHSEHSFQSEVEACQYFLAEMRAIRESSNATRVKPLPTWVQDYARERREGRSP